MYCKGGPPSSEIFAFSFCRNFPSPPWLDNRPQGHGVGHFHSSLAMGTQGAKFMPVKFLAKVSVCSGWSEESGEGSVVYMYSKYRV